jgi:hypothetical protein
MNTLDNQKALQILINAVQMANTKGAFTLQDSKVIAEAVEFFMKPAETKPEDKPKK